MKIPINYSYIIYHKPLNLATYKPTERYPPIGKSPPQHHGLDASSAGVPLWDGAAQIESLGGTGLPRKRWGKNMKMTLLRVIPTMTFIHFVAGKSSGILSDISSGILSGISSGILSGILWTKPYIWVICK